MSDYGIMWDSTYTIPKTDNGNVMPYGARNQTIITPAYGWEIHSEPTGTMAFSKTGKGVSGALRGNVSD